MDWLWPGLIAFVACAVLGVVLAAALAKGRGKGKGRPPPLPSPPGGQGSGSTYTNPVMTDIADPGCIRVGSTYYVCGTQKGGFAIFASTNLRDWKQVADTGQGGCAQCWAPNFLQHNGRFYLVYTDGSNFTGSIAVAEKVTGPYRVICSHGIPGIDGYLFAFESSVYVFYNSIKKGAIMSCGRLSKDMTRVEETRDLFSGPVPELGGQHVEVPVEGPCCTRVGGLLYLSYSFNQVIRYNLSYATATHPFGPWKQSGKALFPADNSGHGHHDIVQTPGGTWVCIYHGALQVNPARNLCVDRMTIGGGKMAIDYHAPGKQAPLIT